MVNKVFNNLLCNSFINFLYSRSPVSALFKPFTVYKITITTSYFEVKFKPSHYNSKSTHVPVTVSKTGFGSNYKRDTRSLREVDYKLASTMLF